MRPYASRWRIKNPVNGEGGLLKGLGTEFPELQNPSSSAHQTANTVSNFARMLKFLQTN